jgi:hypothetical protein
MSPPTPPARRRGSPAESARALRRIIALQLWSGTAPWRWLLVALVFAASALLIEDSLRASFFNRGIRRPVDAWDLFPGMATDFRMQLGLFGFGFPLFVVDTYQRGREQGILTTALARMRSRSLYWLATMGALGVLACAYVCACFLVAFLAGMLLCPPASAWPMLPREALPAMDPPWSMPLPLYTLLLAAYTSWALWITGSIAVFVSLVARRKVVALAFIVLWPVLSISTWDTVSYRGPLRLVNLGYLVGIFKHHLKDPYPMDLFFAVTSAALVLLALLGSWRLRREEL